MAAFPPDRFDETPDDLTRVGAHRAPAPRGRGWIAFAWAALATGILVAGGLYGLSRYDPTFQFDLPSFGAGETTGEPTTEPTDTVEPVTDPSAVDPDLDLTISVLNGTETQGLQNTAGDQIDAAGWPDPARANASNRTEETTTIFYHTTDYEGIALGLAELLGAGEIVLSDAYLGAPVTILLGTDYVPAG